MAFPPRSIARRVPPPLRYGWHRINQHYRLTRERGLSEYLYWNYLKAYLCARAWLNRSRYRWLSEDELKGRRKSDTVFIFGSGYSLNEISEIEWRRLAEHDVFGFSGFIYQDFIRTDFHLIRGWDEGQRGLKGWFRSADTYAGQFNGNSRFADAILLLQGDYTSTFCNTLIGFGMLRPGQAYRYRTNWTLDGRPSTQLARGVVHACGTLSDAVNVAFLLGWKSIVLVGVDLYDSRYFWGPNDATLALDDSGRHVPAMRTPRGVGWNESHRTAQTGIVELMRLWREMFRVHGVELSVYNPRSLLVSVLPVYPRIQRT